jgi:hypothetical protein
LPRVSACFARWSIAADSRPRSTNPVTPLAVSPPIAIIRDPITAAARRRAIVTWDSTAAR